MDAHSKGPEIIEMSSTTATKTVEELRQLFLACSLPEQLVSDNGPQFVSQAFDLFIKINGIKHIRTLPYHPVSNGAAERLVQTFKKAMITEGASKLQQIVSFLLSYGTTPYSTTNTTPAELFMNRMLHTGLNLMCKYSSRSAKANYDKKAEICDRAACNG